MATGVVGIPEKIAVFKGLDRFVIGLAGPFSHYKASVELTDVEGGVVRWAWLIFLLTVGDFLLEE